MAVTHLWVTAAARGGDRILFQNLTGTGRVSKIIRSLFPKVFKKVEKQAESKAIWASKTEATWQSRCSPLLADVTTLSRGAFTKIFPQRSMTSFASTLRLAAARKLMYSGFGKSSKAKNISVFGFVGLCFAMQEETSLSTNEEFICTEIRNTFQGFHSVSRTVTDTKPAAIFCVEDFQFGNFIAKGSCSAVYEAKLVNRFSSNTKSADIQSDESGDDDIFLSSEDDANFSLPSSNTEFPLQTEIAVQFAGGNHTELEDVAVLLSEDSSDFSLLDESDVFTSDSADDDIEVIDESESNSEYQERPHRDDLDELGVVLATALVDDVLAVDSVTHESDHLDELGVVLAAALVDDVLAVDSVTRESNHLDETVFLHDLDSSLHSNDDSQFDLDDSQFDLEDSQFDLAVKMMFNYSAESTAEAVTMAMEKEMVPLKLAHSDTAVTNVEKWKFWRRRKKRKCLPLHPNIVEMKAVFIDQVADFPENHTQYPAALPQRLNPDGLGRNMTMFLVMKRYSSTLRDYIRLKTPDVYESCLLICQILEGVTFLRETGVAHRDLKSDNILLDLTNQNAPWLVISDFGCCLRDDLGLEIPYYTGEISKGGNRALLAPEIACTQPGRFSVLDYRKSDVWTVGSLVYEIFGRENPFYRLDSATYREGDLPPLPDTCPWIVRKLVSSLLLRDPSKRLEPAVAANVMHLFLWWPSWFSKPSNEKVQDWLLAFSREVAYQDISLFISESKASVEHMLQRSFLLRLHFHELIDAVNFIYD
ncbi:uncharacterized protein LOC121374172 [Gigantopelta aegis]|uniref:uncharacterized protein LOC121374172 n=1 Tax=Gigantopelta aegis TaxID=1735272 RepID=UPI001B88781B|nr:uncharacterized protein LOC121374172 [Gigantopelta aegis]